MEWTRKSVKKTTGFIEQLENRLSLSVSNDPYLADQWNINKISAVQTWNTTQGSRDIVVAVVDSGMDINHPDLKNNVWINPGEIANNNIDDDGNGFVDDIHGWNFVENNNNVQDGYGHGTHVAGIIGAEGNNALGIAGINWRVSIMPLRFQNNNGLGFTGEAIQGINYAVMMKQKYHINVVAINASWGNDRGTSSLLVSAINNANNNNILFVCAAGNSGTNCDVDARYPASYDLPNIIAVAATDSYDFLAGFSNYGKNTVEIAAPGISIFSTLPNNNYGYMSGTSQASPQVAAAIALIASVKPNISALEIKNIIFSSVDKLPSLIDKVYTGGRLNIQSALTKTGITIEPENKVYTVSSTPIQPAPIVEKIVSQVRVFTSNRIAGWVYSNILIKEPVNVRLIINDKIVKEYKANIYKSYLRNLLGSTRHGFEISINRKWLSIGSNSVRIEAFNLSTGKIEVLATKIINRVR